MTSKNLKLLLLEDNDDEANDLIETLDDNDYNVKRAANIEEAQELIKNDTFDIIILDIMINGKPDGLTLAQKLDKNNINIPFIFLTSINDRSIFEKAKYTKTFNYLLKPYNDIELLFALELAIETHYSQVNTLSTGNKNAVLCTEYLFVKNNDCVKKVHVASIQYIDVDERYCTLHCSNESFVIKLSLTKIKEILCQITFTQIHRKYLVNTKKIKEIYPKDNLVVLENNTKLNFSERYKAKFMHNNTIYG